MAKKTTKSSTKKTVKPTVNTEPKKIAKSTAKVNSVSKQDSTKTVIDEIKIGDQIWTTKNLDVETYRNGDAIPQVEDREAWKKLTTGAWCYYKNESDNGITYGKLYNGFAVMDPRGLAPKGYHIPSDAEFAILSDYLGDDEAGTKMKSTTGWAENGSGTNTSGFAGLPGGFWHFTGFDGVGSYGFWWSSSEYKTEQNYYRQLSSDESDFGGAFWHKQVGLSVRCLKD